LALGRRFLLVARDQEEKILALLSLETDAIREAHRHLHGDIGPALQDKTEKGMRAIAHLARQDPVRETLFAPLARLVPILQVHSVIQVSEDIRHLNLI
jgi:hypothetical protein